MNTNPELQTGASARIETLNIEQIKELIPNTEYGKYILDLIQQLESLSQNIEPGEHLKAQPDDLLELQTFLSQDFGTYINDLLQMYSLDPATEANIWQALQYQRKEAIDEYNSLVNALALSTDSFDDQKAMYMSRILTCLVKYQVALVPVQQNVLFEGTPKDFLMEHYLNVLANRKLIGIIADSSSGDTVITNYNPQNVDELEYEIIQKNSIFKRMSFMLSAINTAQTLDQSIFYTEVALHSNKEDLTLASISPFLNLLRKTKDINELREKFEVYKAAIIKGVRIGQPPTDETIKANFDFLLAFNQTVQTNPQHYHRLVSALAYGLKGKQFTINVDKQPLPDDSTSYVALHKDLVNPDVPNDIKSILTDIQKENITAVEYSTYKLEEAYKALEALIRMGTTETLKIVKQALEAITQNNLSEDPQVLHSELDRLKVLGLNGVYTNQSTDSVRLMAEALNKYIKPEKLVLPPEEDRLTKMYRQIIIENLTQIVSALENDRYFNSDAIANGVGNRLMLAEQLLNGLLKITDFYLSDRSSQLSQQEPTTDFERAMPSIEDTLNGAIDSIQAAQDITNIKFPTNEQTIDLADSSAGDNFRELILEVMELNRP